MKVKVLGSTAVISTEIKVEDFKLLQDFAPQAIQQKALTPAGEETLQFLGTVGGPRQEGSVSEYGIVFTGADRNDKLISEIRVSDYGSSKVNIEHNVKALAPYFHKVKAYETYIAATAAALRLAQTEAMEEVTFMDDVAAEDSEEA